MRDPEQSGYPLAAPVHTGCTRQYGGWQPSGSTYFTTRLVSSNGSYDVNLAKNFRQWSQLCTITNPTVGDYCIQVRTNLTSGSTSSTALNSTADNPLVTWNGHNRFALRAVVNGTSSNVTLAGYGEMSIYANAPAADTQFYLSRVNAASAGMSNMDIALFDAGDASEAGTITIIPRPTRRRGCVDVDLQLSRSRRCCGDSCVSIHSGKLSTHQRVKHDRGHQRGGYQGNFRPLRVSLPADYSCNEASQFGCWFKIRFCIRVELTMRPRGRPIWWVSLYDSWNDKALPSIVLITAFARIWDFGPLRLVACDQPRQLSHQPCSTSKVLTSAEGGEPSAWNKGANCGALQMPVLEEKGFVVLDSYGDLVDSREWQSLEYVDWKSSGDTRFAPSPAPTAISSATASGTSIHPSRTRMASGLTPKPRSRRPSPGAHRNPAPTSAAAASSNSSRIPTPTRSTTRTSTTTTASTPDGEGWIVRCFMQLTHNPNSYMVLREDINDPRTETRIALPAELQLVVDSERMWHSVWHQGPEPRYCLITSYDRVPN